MNHIAEAASGFVIALAAVGGALMVWPQTNKEAEPLAVTLELQPKPVERAEPLPQKTDAERVDELQRKIIDIAAEQKRLVADVKSLGAVQSAPVKERRREKPK